MSQSRHTTESTTSALVMALGLVAVLAAPASAAAPGNDDLGSATVVGSVPFQDSLDTTEATPQGIDPDCASDDANPTVWYTFTPAQDGRFFARTRGSDYDTTLLVGVRKEGGGVEVIGCNDDWDDWTSLQAWTASAGREYLIMVGACCGGSGGHLELTIERAPPAPSIRLTVASAGRITRLGAVIVRGTVSCRNTQGRAEVEVRARQDFGRRIIRGFGSRRFECNGPWAVSVRNSDFRFTRAALRVRASAHACSELECRSGTVRRTLEVR